MKRLALCVAALLLVGCAPGDPMTGRAASDLPPGPLQPLPSEPATTDAADCRALAISNGGVRSMGSDGELLTLEFTNRGETACTVHGYPTLTLRDSNGRSVGLPATLSTNGAARYIVLEPGASAVATVRFPKTTKACTAGTTRIEILIPAATRREFIAANHPYCPGWTVTAIQRATAAD